MFMRREGLRFRIRVWRPGPAMVKLAPGKLLPRLHLKCVTIDVKGVGSGRIGSERIGGEKARLGIRRRGATFKGRLNPFEYFCFFFSEFKCLKYKRNKNMESGGKENREEREAPAQHAY